MTPETGEGESVYFRTLKYTDPHEPPGNFPQDWPKLSQDDPGARDGESVYPLNRRGIFGPQDRPMMAEDGPLWPHDGPKLSQDDPGAGWVCILLAPKVYRPP